MMARLVKLPAVRVYGVVSVVTSDAVELFVRREDAEAMVDARRRDEPEDADVGDVRLVAVVAEG